MNKIILAFCVLFFSILSFSKDSVDTESGICNDCLTQTNNSKSAVSNIKLATSKKTSILSTATHLTGYFPKNNRMEGGFLDRYGNRLYTLQDFLSGKAPYVSVAIDIKNGMKKYQKTNLCIPELDKTYGPEMTNDVKKRTGGKIIFKAVDTGGRFYNRGWKKMDICVANEKASFDKRLNHKVTITDCN